MTPDAQLSGVGVVERTNPFGPVRLGEILLGKMAEIRLRMAMKAQPMPFPVPPHRPGFLGGQGYEPKRMASVFKNSGTRTANIRTVRRARPLLGKKICDFVRFF